MTRADIAYVDSADAPSPASSETVPRTSGSSSPAVRGDTQVTFSDAGDFAALYAAQAWLKARGFSYGEMQGNSPIAILHGNGISIAKWKNLSAEELNDVHGKIMPSTLVASMRGGPVTIYLRSTVHSYVAAAFRSDPVDTAAREHVEGHV